MLAESLELNLMVVMFGLFLLGLWFEARRTLRAIADEDLALDEEAAAIAGLYESDYETVMARRNARKRLARMREQARQEAIRAAQLEAVGSHYEPEYSGARYDLQIPEFRLIEGGSFARDDRGEVLTTGGARTPMTREGRKTA